MEDKDKIIATLRKQLKDAISRCNALEQENALLSYQLLQAFPGLKECKRHYSVRLTEEDIFRFRNELERIMRLLPHLSEKEWFDIPAYGTDEWANWMIDLHQKRRL